jgi:hypothetical protein
LANPFSLFQVDRAFAARAAAMGNSKSRKSLSNDLDGISGAGQEQAPADSEELARLVWRYFADVITETLIEVQESLSTEQVKQQIGRRKRRKK